MIANHSSILSLYRVMKANSRCQLLDTTMHDVKSSPTPIPNTGQKGNHPTHFLLANRTRAKPPNSCSTNRRRVTVLQEGSGRFPQAAAGCASCRLTGTDALSKRPGRGLPTRRSEGCTARSSCPGEGDTARLRRHAAKRTQPAAGGA